jgi:hypothetical protein
MRLSLIGCASAIMLTAFALTGIGAVAAEVKGQGCDLRGIPGSGCEPGTKVQPAGRNDGAGSNPPLNNNGVGPNGPVDVKLSHGGGGDKPHVNPKSQ